MDLAGKSVPPSPANSLNYGRALRILGKNFSLPTLTQKPEALAGQIYHQTRGAPLKLEWYGSDKSYQSLREEGGSHMAARELLRFSRREQARELSELNSYEEILKAVKKVQYERGRYQATIGAQRNLAGVPNGTSTMDSGLDSSDEVKKANEAYGSSLYLALNRSFFSGKLEVLNMPLSLADLMGLLRTSLTLQFGNLRVVKLINNGLDSVSAEAVKYLSRLESFEVSQNKICIIPSEIRSLKKLKRLVLDFNKVTAICEGICELDRLESLRVAGNSLSVIPPAIGGLESLVELRAGNNHLTMLPKAITRLSKLQTLIMSHNKLKTLALFQELEENIRPDEWKECVHPTTGETYYENRLTKERRRFLEELQQTPCSLERTPHKKAYPDDELPPGWEVLKSEASGKTLYYNASSGESTEQLPLATPCPALDFSRINPSSMKLEKAQAAKERAKLLRSQGLPRWTFMLNDQTGRLEYTDELSGQVFPSMPREIDLFGRLVALTVLSLSCNQLTDLPNSFGRCQQLERLDVDCNQIAVLPDSICDLSSLTRFVANDNKLAFLPQNFGNLTALEQLNLDGNRLESLPPTIQGLTALKTLSLNRNRLNTLPSRLGQLSDTLDVVNVFENPLEHPSQSVVERGTAAIMWDCRERLLREQRGPPPRTLFKKQLGIVNERRMVNHAYRAQLETALEKAHQTRTLHLHFLGLERLPAGITHVPLLQELYVTGQAIEELPSCLNRLRHLRVLTVTGCKVSVIEEGLWGTTEKHAFTNMETIDLSQNRLKVLPKGLTNLRYLSKLCVSGNAITELPENMDKLKRLRHLRAENNLISNLPLGLFKLHKLCTLFLTKNCLKTLREEVGQLQGLERLHIGQNGIDTLPSSLNSLGRLRILQVAHNQLQSMREDFASQNLCRSLVLLNVSANKLEELPTSFMKLKSLQTCIFDMNPIRSPPPQRNGLSWTMAQLQEYHEERASRMKLISSFAQDKAYGLSLDKLYPKVTGAIDEQLGILTV